MSSFKRIYKPQQVHRERQQLKSRQHLGPMEKKKDYKKRAKEQEQFKKTMQNMHKKALSANPDEFQFHMKNSHLKDGVHYENVEGHKLCVDDVNKDLQYITYKRTIEKKKIDKLKAELHLIDPESHIDKNGSKPKHILFVDTEKEAKKSDLPTLLDTHPSLVDRPLNRLTKEQLANFSLTDIETKDIKELSKLRKEQYKMLSRRIVRENKLRILQQKLQVRKQVMNKKDDDVPLVVKEGTKTEAPVYKWRMKRQK